MYIFNIEYIPYNACTYSLSSAYCTSPVIQNSWTGIFVTNWYLYVLTIEYISYNVCAYSLSSTYCTNPVVQISFVYINKYIYIYVCIYNVFFCQQRAYNYINFCPISRSLSIHIYIYVYIYIYIYIHTHTNTHQYLKRGCVSGELYFYLYTLSCGHIDESLTHT